MTATPPATSPLSPQLTLAMAVHSQPGTYALLLGSGVSTGAGIKTGWGIVQHLVQRAATASGASEKEALAAHDDPESWWAAHQEGELLYSKLVALVGGATPAARRGVLSQYFTATPQEIESGIKVPSDAHRAIAKLVEGGFVRLILTTNFDDLTERALTERGITPQVITRPEQVAAMQPLVHAPITIVKLHGNVSELTTRNTPVELSKYPRAWQRLLSRVNAEYGLIVSGWSGETDVALVEAIKRNPMRRYPLYWGSRSKVKGSAREIVAMQGGVEVLAADADDLFTSLARSVTALTKMTAPPLTTALAVAALKSAIGDPTRHVEVEDLVMGAVRACLHEVSQRTVLPKDGYEALLTSNAASAEAVVRLLAAGSWYDRDRRFDDLWRRALSALMSARNHPASGDEADKARMLPAALALRVIGVLGLHRGRYDLVLTLLKRTEANAFGDSMHRLAAAILLRDDMVLDYEQLAGIPSVGHGPFPTSRSLRTMTQDLLATYIVDDSDLSLANDDYEFAVGINQYQMHERSEGPLALGGIYCAPSKWSGSTLTTAVRFSVLVTENVRDRAWAGHALVGTWEFGENVIEGFEEYLRKRQLRAWT